MNDATIKGKSGKKYLFQYYELSPQYAADPPVVYIIVKRIKDTRTNPPSKYYTASAIFGIVEKGIDLTRIHRTESAVGVLCYPCKDADEVNSVLNDLDEAGNLVIEDVPLQEN